MNSSFEVLDGKDDLLYLASYRCGIVIHQLVGWIGDRGRQIRTLSGREALTKFAEPAGNGEQEAARFRVGDKLGIFECDGQQRRFKILGIRKEGDFNLYLARDLDDFGLCCLKERSVTAPDQGALERQLAHEAGASLLVADHPNFLRTISAFRFRSRLIIQTEYALESGTRLDAISPDGISVAAAIMYAIQICRAMTYARGLQPDFVHGGIRPENCFVTPSGVLRLRGPNAARPEIADEVRYDVRSFAATLYEVITGVSAFDRFKSEIRSSNSKLDRSKTELLSDRGAPDGLVDLIHDCLAGGSEPAELSFKLLEERLTKILCGTYGLDFPDCAVLTPSREDLIRRAKSLASLGLIEQAVDCINSATDRFGPKADLLAVRAIISCGGTNLDEAVDSSAAALKTGSDQFVVLLARAQVLLAQGKTDHAEKFLQRALELNPYNCVALNLLGQVFLEKEHLREAWICFDQSVTIDASQFEPLDGLVTIDLKTGNFQKALAKARRAVDLDPERAGSQLLLGDAYKALGKRVEAVNAYKAAVLTGSGDRRFSRAFVRACRELCADQKDPMPASQFRLLIEGTRLLARPKVNREQAGRFACKLLDLIRTDGFDPQRLFYFDVILGKISTKLESRIAERIGCELSAIWGVVRDCDFGEHVFGALGSCFFHVRDFDNCRQVFSYMLDRFGPSGDSYRHLAACSELSGDLHVCLKFYMKARQLNDCERTRANIVRVRSKLLAMKNSREEIHTSRKWQSQTPLL